VKALLALCIIVVVMCLFAISYQAGARDRERALEAEIAHKGPEPMIIGKYTLTTCYWGKSVKIYTVEVEP